MINQGDYDKFQARLIKKARNKAFPLKAMFELTYRCNLKCRHCYVCDGENRKELQTQEVFSILDQLAEAGCLNLGFTGGEPFLRKDIFDILRYAKNKGFNTVLLTNATLIEEADADRLKELGLNKIDVSFHTRKQEVFDWFTQRPGTYKRVSEAVRLLRKKGIDVFLKTTAMTINKDEILALRHLAVEKFGAHFRWSSIITPDLEANKENLRFRLTAEDVNCLEKQIRDDSVIEFEKLDTLEKINRKSAKRQRPIRKINHNQLFHCGAGKTEVVIDPYGQMRLCLDIPFPKYDILKSNFSQSWKMLTDFVRDTAGGSSYQCQDCELIQYCKSCPAYAWLECGDISACPPYFRELARLAKMESETEDIKIA
ncbi:MAG: radical SAM protein [Candidatus Omnitrophica bacterium]|nr:radical SAM protein [Candidatus Omnitrophota bacterium]